MRGVFRASVPLHLLFRLSVQKGAESRLKILIRYRKPEQKLRRYRKPVQILSGYRKQEYWVPKTGNEHEPSFKYRFQIRNTRTPYSKIRSLDSRIWQYSTNKQTNTMSQQHAPTRFSVNNTVFCTGSRYRTTYSCTGTWTTVEAYQPRSRLIVPPLALHCSSLKLGPALAPKDISW